MVQDFSHQQYHTIALKTHGWFRFHGRFQVFSLMWVFGPWSPGRSCCFTPQRTNGGGVEPFWFGKPNKIVNHNLLYTICHLKGFNVPYMFFISIRTQFEPYRFPQSPKFDKEMKTHYWQNAVPGSDAPHKYFLEIHGYSNRSWHCRLSVDSGDTMYVYIYIYTYNLLGIVEYPK